MPDDPDTPQNLPGRHRPRLNELSQQTTEDDLWDLDDAPETAPSAPSEPPPAAAPEARPAPAGAGADAGGPLPDPSQGTPAADTRPPQAPEKAAGAAAAASPSAPTPADTPGRPKPTAKLPDPATPGTSFKEKVALIISGVVALGIGVWLVIGLFSEVPTTRLGDDRPELPAEGAFTTVGALETYWREPIREGENRDVARREVAMIPVVSLSLDDGRSGALRVIFYDDRGSSVGDAITESFSDGRFDQTGDATIEIAATDGFSDPGDFDAYRVGGERWTLEIREGPSSNASGSEFEKLVAAPISSIRR